MEAEILNYIWEDNHDQTMFLPKLNHIVSVVPNPNIFYLQQLNTEFRRFIYDNNPNVVDKTKWGTGNAIY
jgi:hypothetical protein